MVPVEVRGRAEPPSADDSQIESRSRPSAFEVAVCTMCSPGPRVTPFAELPHPESCRAPLESAVAVDPLTCTSTGVPSIVRRSSRHADVVVAGVGGASTPGMPTSAIPIGSVCAELE